MSARSLPPPNDVRSATEVGLLPTLESRLFGSGDVVHDVTEWKGEPQSRMTYRWGKTRCGYFGKTWDVATWGRKPRPCKVCEARRGA